MTVFAVFLSEIRPSEAWKLVVDHSAGYENDNGNRESLKIVSSRPNFEFELEVAFGTVIVVGRITKLEAIKLKVGKFSSNSPVGARNVRV